MALTFGAATSDRVDCGVIAAVATPTTWTWYGWVYLTTVTAGRRLFSNSDSSSPFGGIDLRINASALLRADVARVTTDSQYIASNRALATNTWTFVAVTYDSGAAAGELFNIYTGTLTGAAVECTYGTVTDGSGALDVSTAPFCLYGSPLAGGSVALQGRGGVSALFDRAMPLGEILSHQFDPRVAAGCVGFWRLGDQGTGTQTDYSGSNNHGTVSGATQVDGPPLRKWRRRSGSTPYVVSSGTTVNLTGQAITFAQGAPSVRVDCSLSLTGQSIAFAQGTVTARADVSPALTGQSITAAQGTLATRSDASIALTGQAMTAALGLPTVLSGTVVSLTGQAITAAVGTLTETASGSVTLVGQAATFTQGSVTALPNTLVSLTGQSTTLTQGTLAETASANVPLTGQAITASQGSPSVSVGGNLTFNLTGQSITASVGTLAVTAGCSVALTGQNVTAATGTLTFTASASVVILGQSATFTLGTIRVPSGVDAQYTVTSRTGPLYTVASRSGPRFTVTRGH